MPRKNPDGDDVYKYSIYVLRETTDAASVRKLLESSKLRVIGNMAWHKKVGPVYDGDVYYYQMESSFDVHLNRAPDLLHHISMVVLPLGMNPSKLLKHKLVNKYFSQYKTVDDKYMIDFDSPLKYLKSIYFRKELSSLNGFESNLKRMMLLDPNFSAKIEDAVHVPDIKEVTVSDDFKMIDFDHYDTRANDIVCDPLPSTSYVASSCASVTDEYEKCNRVDESIEKKKVGRYVLDVMFSQRCPIRSVDGRILVWDTMVPENYVNFDQIGKLDFKSAVEISLNGCPNSIVLRWLLDSKGMMYNKNGLFFDNIVKLPAWMTFTSWFDGVYGYVLKTNGSERMFSCEESVDVRTIVQKEGVDAYSFLLYFFQNASVGRIINTFYPRDF